MVYRNGQNLISQIKNDLENLDKYVKEASNEEIDGALDLLLFSFLANERKFIDDLKEENLTDEGNTKNKYKFFNPETMIGISCKKKNGAFINPITKEREQKEFIIMENIAKPYFSVGQATRKQIEDKQDVSVLHIKQPISTDRKHPEIVIEKTFTPKYKGMDLIASSQYSKYFANKDGNVFFTGIYPKKIDKLKTKIDEMSLEDIEEYMSEKILSEPYKHPTNLSLEYSKVPTFYTIFDGLCNSISHNKVTSRDHYFYFEINDRSMPMRGPNRPHYASIIIDKDWARAVCDTIMFAKSFMIKEDLSNDLQSLITSEKPTKEETITHIKDCLKEYGVSDYNIEHMSDLLNTKIPDVIEEKEYVINKIAEYISIFDTSFDDESSPAGLKLPSKLYLILMDKIVDARAHRKDNKDEINAIQKELREEHKKLITRQNLFAQSVKKCGRGYETASAAVSEKILSELNEFQIKADKLTKPFSGSFMFSPEYLDLDNDIDNETKALLGLTQCLYPLNGFLTKHFENVHKKMNTVKLNDMGDYEVFNTILRNNLQECFDYSSYGLVKTRTGDMRIKKADKNNIDTIGFINALKAIRVSTYHGNTKFDVQDDKLFLKFYRVHDDIYLRSDNSSKTTTIVIESDSMCKLADSNIIDTVFPEQVYGFKDTKKYYEDPSVNKNAEYDYNLPEPPAEDDENKSKV